ncbi:multidrug and toxin extrusion protein 1 isoform X4 [Cottoperca gobio]|uniref:Multidrug and toxin extrusion protein n=1 Tax=Cottoperca gobio TaxID=56716 RepID=A0A6J2R0Q8_COTGO|nr:multidrug and toxin extrusion protein 1-like isoform X4 [Cottoperca gobio]
MESSTQRSPLSSWRDCFVLKRIRMLVPVGFKAEIIELSKLSGPVIISQLMVFLVSFVSTVFCGHLGKTELAGVSLAIAVINVTGISIGSGLAAACDTLISQTFGSRNLLRVGVILQRAILILLLACFPCWAILINTEPILLAVKQKPEVARLSQLYVKIFMPALPATFMYSLETRYLQNQGIIWPQVITGIVVNLLNALINYIFLYILNMGVAGSAVANALSQFSMAAILYAYILWKGLHKATWGGWSKECLQDWGSYIHLAIPSMVMLCVEWWSYEIGGFLAGLISETELGAQSVVYGLANVAYMFPMGFGIAGNVRVGNALGAGDTEQAKLSAKLTVFCAVSVSICLSVLLGSLKNHISYIFTYDEQIRERVADIISLYAPFVLLDAIAASLGGIIRGAGKQRIGAICNILGYYGVGFTVGVPLMFVAKLGIQGLWIGLFTCVFLQSSFLIFYLLRMNWKKATTEAQIRAGVCGRSTDTSPQPDDTDTLDPVDTEAEPAVKTVEEEQLSHRSLVLRRGLALAAMLFILADGIIMNLLITNLIT